MDVSLVKSVVEDAKKEYVEKAKVRAPNITIDNVYLPPPPTDADPHRPAWYLPTHSFIFVLQLFIFLFQLQMEIDLFILKTFTLI